MKLGKSWMRLMLLVLLFCFVEIKGAHGSAAPSNAELFEYIKQLQAVVNEQAERIKDLEMCYGECKFSIEKHEESLVQLKKEIGADVSQQMKKQFERMGETGIAGLYIGGGATFIGQGTPNANAAGSDGNGNTEDSRFDVSYSADVEIAKEFGDYGLAFLHLETGDGDTVEGDLSLYPGTGVNRDADTAGSIISLTEAWYEQYMFNGQLMITGGKIDPTAYIDTNNFANDECHQFMGAMFRNASTIEFPDNNFGARAYFSSKLISAFDISATCLEGDGNWEEVFDSPFIATQINFMPEKFFNLEKSMWEGNYRGYFWYNGTDHTELKDAAKTKEPNYGFGLSFDQNIADIFGVFQRFGWQNPKVSTLEYYWSAGGQMTGKYWNRSDDILAIGVGQGIPGKDYRDTEASHRVQTNLEAYYSFKVNDHLTLTPDMQCIWDPNGENEKDPIFVYGIRGQIDL